MKFPPPIAQLFRFVPAVGWAVAILWLSLDPAPPRFNLGPAAWDKFQHAAAYALLTLFVGVPLAGQFRRGRLFWVNTFFLVVLYGGILELAQWKLTTARSAEWGDLLADVVGAGLVAGLAWIRSDRSA